jgi:hypothetical protein
LLDIDRRRRNRVAALLTALALAAVCTAALAGPAAAKPSKIVGADTQASVQRAPGRR